ncbi:hypothetical protein V6N13_124385 [Hibiscus sabdariffa]
MMVGVPSVYVVTTSSNEDDTLLARKKVEVKEKLGVVFGFSDSGDNIEVFFKHGGNIKVFVDVRHVTITKSTVVTNLSLKIGGRKGYSHKIGARYKSLCVKNVLLVKDPKDFDVMAFLDDVISSPFEDIMIEEVDLDLKVFFFCGGKRKKDLASYEGGSKGDVLEEEM